MIDQTNPALDALRAKAETGDATAQMNLGRVLAGGNFEEALSWMEKAAKEDLAEAMYMLGVWHTDGIFKPREIKKGLQLLEKAEENGLPRAGHYRAYLKARGIGFKPDWAGGVADETALAKKENPFALSQLGFLLLMTGRGEDDRIGREVIRIAAAKGNPEALKVFPGAGQGENGHEPIDFEKISRALATPPDPPLPKAHNFSLKPRIAAFPGFIPPEIADYLISRAKPGLRPSMVIDHVRGSFVKEEYRTSTEFRFLPAQADLVTHAVCLMIAKASEEDIGHQETLGVLRYQPGQEYRPHSDFLKADATGTNPEVERAGQRIKTFLIYLNEEFEGGETDFPKLGVRVRGGKGDGILFSSVMDNGEESQLAVHAGRPVERGEKFITTLWIRDRVYSYPKSGD